MSACNWSVWAWFVWSMMFERCSYSIIFKLWPAAYGDWGWSIAEPVLIVGNKMTGVHKVINVVCRENQSVWSPGDAVSLFSTRAALKTIHCRFISSVWPLTVSQLKPQRGHRKETTVGYLKRKKLNGLLKTIRLNVAAIHLVSHNYTHPGQISSSLSS